jgi:predicted Zn finger-like uncharacterized protein
LQVVCERCTTAYDFPESNVPAGGVTVKCAGCGHRFRVVRVRRKTIPVMVPPAAGAIPPGEGPWQVRTARGEVFPLPDIALLRGWILERKVTRDDELANAAGLWRKLGSIPEYAGAFIDVDRAIATQRTTPAIRSLDEFTAQAGARQRAQTIELKIPVGGFKQPPPGAPPLAPPLPAKRPTPQPVEEDALEARSVHRFRPLAIVAAVVVVGAAAAAARLFLLDGGPSAEYVRARELLLTDDDTDLVGAEAAFRAIEGGEEALAKAGLAETQATRAHYKLLEAEALERAGSASAAADKRREARAEADQARRVVDSTGAEAGPEANRALADAMRVGGSAAAEIEALLAKVRAARPGDPESLYVEGALRLRDGKRVIAVNLLEEATQRFEAATRRPLVRADYLLATILAADKKNEEAKTRLRRVLVARPGHKRAERLLEQIESGTAGAGTAGPAAPPPTPSAPAAASPDGGSGAAPAGGGGGGGSGGGAIDKAIRNDYGALVAEADRVAEEGRSARAAKLYERALEVQPRGVEAMTGLAYCYMDEGKYPLALSQFRRVLGAKPNHGDAIIGLAEAYKLKGSPKQALEYYRRYLKEHPGGPKAGMAQAAVRDLEWKYGGPKPAPEPSGSPPPEQGQPPAPAPEGEPQPTSTTP